MDEGGEVLRFRPRGLFEEPVAADWSEPDDPDAHRRDGDPALRGGGLGDLTQVVLIGDQVVDVVRGPVSGSGYECAALELADRGLLRRPAPPPAPPPSAPPAHEQQLAWLARIVGGDDALEALGVEPLPPEDLCLDGVRADVHERVRGIDERLVRWAPALLGGEGLTAARRLLEPGGGPRAGSRHPQRARRHRHGGRAVGRREGQRPRGHQPAGAGRRHPGRLRLRSAPSGRGSAFAHAVGGDGSTHDGRPLWMFDSRPAVIPLGSPDLLLRRFRQRLVLMRDLALQLRARMPVSG